MNNKAFNIDCMLAMKDTPDKFYEIGIIDPPYGIGCDKENLSMSAGLRKDGSQRADKTWNNKKGKNYTVKQWDSSKPSNEYFTELFRVTKNQIIWGGNYFTDILKPHGGWIVWEKGVPEGFSLSQAELAYNSFLNSIRIVKILWAGYLKNEPCDRFHPTQKPVALYKWLLKNYAKTGDKILDTHLGSGSSRIACYDMGFDFTGYELDKEYFDKQEERFANHIAQSRMFQDEETPVILEQKELF